MLHKFEVGFLFSNWLVIMYFLLRAAQFRNCVNLQIVQNIFLEYAPDLNEHRNPFKRRGFHCSIRNKRQVSNKCPGPKWACLTYCRNTVSTWCSLPSAKFASSDQSAICQAISLSSDFSLMFVEQLSFGVSGGGRQA